MEMETVKEEVM